MHLVEQREVLERQFAHLTANRCYVGILQAHSEADNVDQQASHDRCNYRICSSFEFISKRVGDLADDGIQDGSDDWLDPTLTVEQDEGEADD